MTYEEFTNRYTYDPNLDRIGNGKFGLFYKAYDNVLHREVTIKKVMTEAKSHYREAYFWNEFVFAINLKDEYEVLKHIPKHKNVAYYDEHYSFDGYDYAILPYKVEFDLCDLMQQSLTMNQKESIALQLLDGVDFLHKYQIYGCFDSWNVLMIKTRDGFTPIITNLGVKPKAVNISPDAFGPPRFLNHCFLGLGDTIGYDLEMYGIILYELFMGRPLYKDFEEPYNWYCNEMARVDDYPSTTAFEMYWKIIKGLSVELLAPWRNVFEKCVIPDNIYGFVKHDNITTEDLYDIINGKNSYINNIKGYSLVKKLSDNVLAETWLAENTLGKTVEVKMLDSGVCFHKDIVAAFEDESKVLSDLEHPNIQRVYDCLMKDDRLCIIKEYLDGCDLETMMKQGHSFTDEELVKWWNQIVKALDYAHSKGVIHRDIKPSNIFIDKNGDVKLLNFDIAKNAIKGFVVQIMTEIPSWLYTSPMYMSPEQIRDTKHVDNRSDAYSLAVTFVSLLSGKPPYDSDINSDFDIQRNIVYKPLDISALPLFWRDVLTPYLIKEAGNRPELEIITNTPYSSENQGDENNVINGYVLQYQLGEGGMAEVWYAENKIGKKAAVKMLSPKFCRDEAVVARFENEARVMVRLEHPNIRQVYDYATIDGRPCIIMEYIEGSDLKSMMKLGYQFSDDELVKWWNQMAQALNYTHKMGVVHRDIKPSNIFIDNRGNVKLLDFGIAKNDDNAANTLTGSSMGTLLYMSPEQVKDPKRVGYKTDLYSLAVTFVHLITGKAPYDSMNSSNFEIQMNIVRKPLDISALPPTWSAFLEPYLDKDPKNRPESTEFIERPFGDIDLRENKLTEDETIIANKPNTDYYDDFVTENDNGDLVFNVKGVFFVMKKVEGGTFQMGGTPVVHALESERECISVTHSQKDKSVQIVRLGNYYIGETPVTQALWTAVMGKNPSYFKGDDLPVDFGQISYEDGDIISKLKDITGYSFRLPTEAEWEFAARGGRNSNGYKYAGAYDYNKVSLVQLLIDKGEITHEEAKHHPLKGEMINGLNDVAWYYENSSGTTHPVKQKAPNELGIYDMCGNVMEPCVGGVSKGGCYAYDYKDCQIVSREDGSITTKGSWHGLRLALSCE